jgi:predicted nucleotidyltransferase
MNQLYQEYQENLAEIVDAIVKTGLAQKIIVFGSYARKEIKENSDIDICVLTNDTQRRNLDVTLDIGRVIGRIKRVPTDLLVYKPDEYARRKDILNSVVQEIHNEGIVYYEQ